MASSDWSERLGSALASALTGRGFTALTPVQEAVLAPEYEGRDLRISSKTGSGKTVALGLSLRDDVTKEPDSPVAFVVTPTRELAKQVQEELSWLFAETGATVASVTGGSSYRDERRALAVHPAIIVGTPGRLLDHLRRGSIDASGVGAIVLDEADRMLDLGFREDIEELLGFTPEGHRTHLVSATFSHEVKSLADRVQKNPVHVQGTPLGSANEDIEHVIHLVPENERFDALVNLMLATPGGQTLIFARTRADVSDLSNALRDAGFVVGMLSGEMDQPERNRALAAFKRGHFDALVATDVAARGIDVQDIDRVVHAEPPSDVDAYTHRSGRTGRAGRKGTSSVLVSPRVLSKTQRLLARAGVRYRMEPVPGPDQIRALRDERVLDILTRDPEEGEEGERAEEPDERVLALAQRILDGENAARAVARLLLRSRATGPAEPRAVSTIAMPSRPARPERPEPAERPRRGGTMPSERPQRDWTLFRASWGQAHGADARRLLAMACRRGGITSGEIGSIRVARTYSLFEVATDVADSFAAATKEPDPRDPRVTIRRFEEGGAPRHDAPPARAPRGDAPPPPRAPRVDAAPPAPPPPPPPPPAGRFQRAEGPPPGRSAERPRYAPREDRNAPPYAPRPRREAPPREAPAAAPMRPFRGGAAAEPDRPRRRASEERAPAPAPARGERTAPERPRFAGKPQRPGAPARRSEGHAPPKRRTPKR